MAQTSIVAKKLDRKEYPDIAFLVRESGSPVTRMMNGNKYIKIM